MGTEPKRILVIQTAFLGDVVLTTPLLQSLRNRFPKSHIAVLVIPGTAEILIGHPGLDEVLVFDKKKKDRGMSGLFRTARGLSEGRYDLCLLPHRSFRSALLAYLAGISERIGFAQAPGFFLYTRRVRRDSSRHEVRRNLQLLEPIGSGNGSTKTPDFEKLWVSTEPADMEWANHRLKEVGVEENDSPIAIAPGSVWATKRWLPEKFAEVIDHLIGRMNKKVILLGSRADAPIADQIRAHCREKPIDLTGQTTLRQMAAVLSRSAVLITNDNGAMHVGVAQGIPIVAVFGSTTLSLGYGPFSPKASVVERPLDCRPCGKHGYAECPLGHFNCMKQVMSEEVVAAAEKWLGTP